MKTEAGNRLYNEQQTLENSRQQRADETVLANEIIVGLKAEKMDDRSHVMEAFEYDKVIRPTQWEVEAYNTWKTARETFQFVLDMAGLVPVVGEIFDVFNGCIYLVRGNIGEAGKLKRLGKVTSLGKRFSKFVRFGDNFVDAAKWMRGASKVDKMHGFSKICRMDIPACFVGDIQIVMAGRPNDPAATPITAAPITTTAAGPNWLYSAIILGLGITTYTGLNRRKRRLEQHERDAMIDALFNSDEDLDNLDDDLCTTLARQTKAFVRNDFPALNQPPSPGVATPGSGAMPTFAVGMSSRASTPTTCAVLDRPAAKPTIDHSPRLRRGAAIERDPLAQQRLESRSQPMSIRRWQPRKTSTPIPKPRRSRLGLAVLGACILLAGLFGLRAYNAPKPTPHSAPTAPVSFHGPWTKSIQDVFLGERTLGTNPLTERRERTLPDPDPKTWRELHFHMTKANGLSLWIELLRSLEWIEAVGAAEGSNIYLELPEMGAVGQAEITHLGPCPPIQPGEGNVVTGKFRHELGPDARVVEVRLDADVEPIRCTDNHPFWSVDRQEYVPIGRLHPGDQVQTDRSGTVRIRSITPYQHNGFVYNLEIHGQHVYEVSTLGVLVHNNCLTASHHPIPMFMGGFKKGQQMSRLPVPVHKEFHSLLSEGLKSDTCRQWVPRVEALRRGQRT